MPFAGQTLPMAKAGAGLDLADTGFAGIWLKTTRPGQRP